MRNQQSQPGLQPNKTTPASVPPAPVRARSHAQRAGILCNDPRFWTFLREDRRIIVEHEEHAASYVRGFCDVQSRSEIRSGTVAEQRWNLLVSAYDAWNLAPACGAA